MTCTNCIIFEINLINPLRLLSSWHLTHLLCFNSVLRIYDLRPVPLCTLESLTSTGNLSFIFCCPNMSKNDFIHLWIHDSQSCTGNGIRTRISTLKGWPPKPVSKIPAGKCVRVLFYECTCSTHKSSRGTWSTFRPTFGHWRI